MSEALAEQIRRLEQQIAAFERLHGDELRRMEEQLVTYRRLQADELQMLREQVRQLREAAASGPDAGDNMAGLEPVMLAAVRREGA